MPTRRSFLAAAAAFPFVNKPACAASTPVDIDLVTGFDLSSSMRMQAPSHLRAMATALSSPAFLEKLTEGPNGLARIEIYGWAEGLRPLLAPQLIRRGHAKTDMQAFLKPLHQALEVEPIYMGLSPQGPLGFRQPVYIMPPDLPNIIANGGNTNTGLAMEGGSRLLASRHANRKVLNIVTDDNNSRTGSQEELTVQQAYAFNRGITINGLVIGDTAAMNHYFTKYVRTPDGFILSTADIPKVPEIWERKFSQDLIG